MRALLKKQGTDPITPLVASRSQTQYVRQFGGCSSRPISLTRMVSCSAVNDKIGRLQFAYTPMPIVESNDRVLRQWSFSVQRSAFRRGLGASQSSLEHHVRRSIRLRSQFVDRNNCSHFRDYPDLQSRTVCAGPRIPILCQTRFDESVLFVILLLRM